MGLFVGCRGNATAPPSQVTSDLSDAAAPDASGACSVPDASMSGAGVSPSATCSTTGRVICDASLVGARPGAAVIAVEGKGPPPVPMGGAVTPGDYVLVAQAVWGAPPPDTVGWPRPGDLTAAVLHASCDTYNMVFNGPDSPPDSGAGYGASGGNSCARLVPQAIPLVALAGYTGTDPWKDLTPYSATPDVLTLIQLEPFESGLSLVEGTLTIVQQFALVGATPAVVDYSSGPDCSPPPSGAPRDPRCPASVPVTGQPCNPDPAPLECEYGGDAYGRCTTRAICTLVPDGTFQFLAPEVVPNPAAPCGANAPACPATYAAASAQIGPDPNDCSSGKRLLCDYPEGVCGCGSVSSESAWTCGPRPGPTDPCPTDRPLSGDRCTVEGQRCQYGGGCIGGTFAGPPMLCENGWWEELDELFSCPAIGP